MCGIAGIVSGGSPIEAGAVEAMIGAIGHRGPDDVGFAKVQGVEAGMCRLAILDLSSEGLCPVTHREPKGQIVLLYNGEIYNYVELRNDLRRMGYRFRTTSDSEVLLHAYREWGESCLERLNGMFAFAIIDEPRDRLFAARDRAGEKPFYYVDDGKRFMFASEMKGLLTQITDLQPQITDEFRAFEYLPGEDTLFRGVKALLPAHKLVLNGLRERKGPIRVEEYWNAADHVREIRPQDAVDELDELLQDSVRIRLRADVPWGIYLSGGIDSSLIAALASPPVSFSCHFPYGPGFDELLYAEMIAKQVGSEHIVVRPTYEDFEEHFSEMIYHLDVPIGSFSVFPLFMLAREARNHVKIVLSGEGADELFSGYTRYLVQAHEQRLYDAPEIQGYKPLLDRYYGPAVTRFARLLNRSALPNSIVQSVIEPHFSRFDSVAHAMGYTEFKLMLVTLLQMEDRASAAFGLENRSPFLDHRIIEFAFSIPEDLKIRGTTTKWILKQVAARYLPKAVVERTHKMGLIAPINRWLKITEQNGDFGREGYYELAMRKWREVFFEQRWFADADNRSELLKLA